MAYHRVTVASSRSRVNREVEALRRRIPLPLYLDLMHQAAVTGYLPRLDLHGRPIPTPEDQQELLTAPQRIGVLQYLTDKAMPNIHLDPEPPPPELPHSIPAEALRDLSNEQLALILESAQDADPPAATPLVHSPAEPATGSPFI